MKNSNILFRLVFSDRILTRHEKNELLKRDPGAGIFLHPIDTSPHYFSFNGSNNFYSLDEIREVIRINPSALWTAHEVKPPLTNRKNDRIVDIGKMNSTEIIKKFG
jgi:hypothetical protein